MRTPVCLDRRMYNIIVCILHCMASSINQTAYHLSLSLSLSRCMNGQFQYLRNIMQCAEHLHCLNQMVHTRVILEHVACISRDIARMLTLLLTLFNFGRLTWETTTDTRISRFHCICSRMNCENVCTSFRHPKKGTLPAPKVKFQFYTQMIVNELEIWIFSLVLRGKFFSFGTEFKFYYERW